MSNPLPENPHPRTRMQGPRSGLPVTGLQAGELPYAERRSRAGRIVAVVLLVGAFVVAGAAVVAARDGGSSATATRAADEPDPGGRPTPPTSAPATTGPPSAGPSSTTEAGTGTTVAVADLPRHEAVYRDGRLILQGTVPSQAVADRFREKAAAVIGEDNVEVRYVIDPRVSVPTDGRVRVDEDFLFATGSAAIDPAYEPLMQLGVTVLELNPHARMRIVGYTDSTGSPERNQELSEARAEALRAYVSGHGIDEGRIEAVGRGPADPVASNDTEAGRSKNRRIEVELLDLLAD